MKKRIGILTSSRADYSIYYPLLRALQESEQYEPVILAFGTHLSAEFGHTVDAILADGFEVPVQVTALPKDGSPAAIAANMGAVMTAFSEIWAGHHFDLVFCLGDRYEMFAAVAAGLPFNIPFAHLYGGETTQGAIDDALRHAITHMSRYHFTSCEPYRQKVIALKGSEAHVYNPGALSFDNLRNLSLLSKEELSAHTGVDFSRPVILTTFHPETVDFGRNNQYAEELCRALAALTEFEVLITMPNADTSHEVLRTSFLELAAANVHIHTTENLGTLRYLSAMKHCALMLGNTSSGFVEASWFPTRVINLGHRQDGRILTPNIHGCEVETNAILKTVREVAAGPVPPAPGVYGDGYAAEKIMAILPSLLN